MRGYAFIYGVDGFGADVAPALEEGIFLNYEEAFQKQLKLNDMWYDEEGYKTFGSIEEACVAINNDVGDPPFDAYRIEPVKIIE